MKRIASFLVLLVLAVSMMVPFPIDLPFDLALPASAASSGTTGDCTWKLNNGVLTISGNGDMGGYTIESSPPWGKSIKSVVIEDGVTSIGSRSFAECTGLTSVTIPDSVKSIMYWAFADCTGLTSVNLGNGVTIIEVCAFNGCTNLTSVVIPDSVTIIEMSAFAYCSGLTSVTIGSGVTDIGGDGGWTFDLCENLKDVYITDLAAWCRIDFEDCMCNPLYFAENFYLNSELVTELKIPDSVTSIGNYAFCNFDGFYSVTIPYTVQALGSSVFSERVLLCVHKDSAGHRYALNKGNPYQINAFTVRFLNNDGTVLKTEIVEYGKNATPPEVPAKEGYTFMGWDHSYEAIFSDMVLTALWRKDEEPDSAEHVPSISGDGYIVCSICGEPIEIADGIHSIGGTNYLIRDGRLVHGENGVWSNGTEYYILNGRPAGLGVHTISGEKVYVVSGNRKAEGFVVVTSETYAKALGVTAGQNCLFEGGKLVDGKFATWTNGKEYLMIKGRPAMGGVFVYEGKNVYIRTDGIFADGVWTVKKEQDCEKLGVEPGRGCLFENGVLVHGKRDTWVNGRDYYMDKGRPFRQGVSYIDGEAYYIISYDYAQGVWKLNGDYAYVAEAFGVEAGKAYLFEDGKLVDGRNARWSDGKEYYIVKGRPVF